MPVVILRYSPKKVDNTVLHQLLEHIPKLVAHALDIPGSAEARLKSTDIEVWVRPAHDLDVNTKDVEVLIFAHSYSDRLRNLEERNELIRRGIWDLLHKCNCRVSGWVWTHLNQTAFGQIKFD